MRRSTSRRSRPCRTVITYRQLLLNVAGAGRVKVLEEPPADAAGRGQSPCVMVLMLAGAQSKETLRFFRDRGNKLGFVPREDDLPAHHAAAARAANLTPMRRLAPAKLIAAQMGSIVKSSLGKCGAPAPDGRDRRRPPCGYTENALKTLDGFNPASCWSCRPRRVWRSARARALNVLVDVRGTDLQDAQMIKLPIHVDVQHWSDWRPAWRPAWSKLGCPAARGRGAAWRNGRYVRPILLVQVERTGATRWTRGLHPRRARQGLSAATGLHGAADCRQTSGRTTCRRPRTSTC